MTDGVEFIDDYENLVLPGDDDKDDIGKSGIDGGAPGGKSNGNK